MQVTNPQHQGTLDPEKHWRGEISKYEGSDEPDAKQWVKYAEAQLNKWMKKQGRG